MRSLLLALTLLALCAVPAAGQTIIAVDINKAKLYWTWTKGTGGDATEFRVKYGQATGTYTKTTPVPAPATTTALVSAIAGPGQWYCVVTAANEFGESPPSNEIAFRAGQVPSSPNDLVIQAQ